MNAAVRAVLSLVWAAACAVGGGLLLAFGAPRFAESFGPDLGGLIALIVAGIAVAGMASASAALSGLGLLVVGGVQLLATALMAVLMLTGSAAFYSASLDVLGFEAGLEFQVWTLTGGFAVGGAMLIAGGVAVGVRRGAVPPTPTARIVASLVGGIAGVLGIVCVFFSAPATQATLQYLDPQGPPYLLVGAAAVLFAIAAASVRWSGWGALAAGAVGFLLALFVFAAVLLRIASPQSELLAIVYPNFSFALYGVLPVLSLQLALLGGAALTVRFRDAGADAGSSPWLAPGRTPVVVPTVPQAAPVGVPATAPLAPQAPPSPGTTPPPPTTA